MPRIDSDYEKLADYALNLNADIIALQEVDDYKAAQRIFPSDKYDFHFSSRNSKQKVGFAIRNNIKWKPEDDIKELDVGRVRYGVQITINPDSESELDLLAVHMKSFCFSKPRTFQSADCEKFWKQVPIIEQWIDEKSKLGRSFVVLGDFNRRLNINDDVWKEWNDGDPDTLNIELATLGRKSDCWGGKYPEYIDHIITSGVDVVFGSFDQVVYETSGSEKLSDHCPISVNIEVD